MTKIIYYFLYDVNENKVYKIHNNKDIVLHIVKGNEEFLTANRCGTRAHIVYIDKQLNIKPYREWIDTCIKPMLSLTGGVPTICFI